MKRVSFHVAKIVTTVLLLLCAVMIVFLVVTLPRLFAFGRARMVSPPPVLAHVDVDATVAVSVAVAVDEINDDEDDDEEEEEDDDDDDKAAHGLHRNDRKFEGYITFCPCMGRIGNQLSQTLGVFAFARRLRRKLLLPPFVEYFPDRRDAVMIPWDEYFNVSVANRYIPVRTLESFLVGNGSEKADEARRIWPPERRRAFCPAPRPITRTTTTNMVAAAEVGGGSDESRMSCGATEGNPFGPFWSYLNVTFVEGMDVLYGLSTAELAAAAENATAWAPAAPLSYASPASEWADAFPPSEYPVLAFTGAPAPFPERAEDRPLQEYIVFSDVWKERGKEWRRRNVDSLLVDTHSDSVGRGEGRGYGSGATVVGLHLRNGRDWANACSRSKSVSGRQFMASSQCLGDRNEHGILTEDMCLPRIETVLRKLRSIVAEFGAAAVVVASDGDSMVEEIRRSLPEGIVVVVLPKDDVHLTLVVLSQSNVFVGNCVSSFTAIVSRMRAVEGGGSLPTRFWAFPPGSVAARENSSDQV